MEQENIASKYNYKDPKNILILASIVLLAGIIIVSILRERIVRQNEDVTTVIGRGKVSYRPDIAVVTLGIQIDKAARAEEALGKLADSMNKVAASAKSLNIPAEDIQTESYSLFPHYDYPNQGGTSIASGYDANQQVSIKVRGIDSNPNLAGRVIEEAGKVGANQVVGITFDVSNLEELKQKARVEAINDARSKTSGLAKAAGIGNPGRVVSWYENIIKAPDNSNSAYGVGGGGAGMEKSANSTPQIPNGTQEIIIEMGLNYRIR
ncbi:MAG: SIMPL domain-containing protein [bacterium]|nr:SIMPL domain-containing protein [bacterium]